MLVANLVIVEEDPDGIPPLPPLNILEPVTIRRQDHSAVAFAIVAQNGPNFCYRHPFLDPIKVLLVDAGTEEPRKRRAYSDEQNGAKA